MNPLAPAQATVDTPHGPRACLEARVDRGGGRKPLIARFGGIPLKRQKTAILIDREPVPATTRKELVTRLLAGRCEVCHSTKDIQVHHVRELADLDQPGPPSDWIKIMARRRRKTLVVCQTLP